LKKLAAGSLSPKKQTKSPKAGKHRATPYEKKAPKRAASLT